MMFDKLREITGDLVPPVFEASDYPRALKIGIRDDLVARFPHVKPWRLAGWIALWCRRIQYHRAVARGGVRFNLDGNPAGRITEAERAYGREIVARMQKPRPKTVGKGGRPILQLKGAA